MPAAGCHRIPVFKFFLLHISCLPFLFITVPLNWSAGNTPVGNFPLLATGVVPSALMSVSGGGGLPQAGYPLPRRWRHLAVPIVFFTLYRWSFQIFQTSSAPHIPSAGGVVSLMPHFRLSCLNQCFMQCISPCRSFMHPLFYPIESHYILYTTICVIIQNKSHS